MLKPADENYVDYSPIEPSDLDHLIAEMVKGKAYVFDDVYAEYCNIVEAELRIPAHRTGFARAMAARSGIFRTRATITINGKRRQVRVLVRRS